MKGIHHMPSTTVATVAHSPAYDNLLSEALAMFLPVGVLGVSPGTFGPCQLTFLFGLSSCHISPALEPPAIYGTLTHYPGGSTVRLRVTPVTLEHAPARGRWRCIEQVVSPDDPADCEYWRGVEPQADCGYWAALAHECHMHPMDCLLQWSPTVRGAIKDFSRRSRFRMQCKVGQVDLRALGQYPKFITLTYPAEWPADAATCANQLDNFIKALVRKCGKKALVWKKELQTRGAPHFHLMLFYEPYLAHEWVAATWYRIVGSNDPRHFAAGTQIKLCHSANQVRAYVAKYLGKPTDERTGDGAAGGRQWGVRNWGLLPIIERVVPLSPKEFYAARRVLCRIKMRRGLSVPPIGLQCGPGSYYPIPPRRLGVSGLMPGDYVAAYAAALPPSALRPSPSAPGWEC